MKHALSLLAGLLLAGCAATTPRPAPTPKPAPPPVAAAVAPAPAAKPAGPGPDDLLQATVWTQLSVEHDLVYREVYRNAREKLLRALHDKTWDALPHDERTGSVRGLKPAVILDVDETVLDNSAYEARLIRNGTWYNDASFGMWAREEKARALPGALAFTRFADRHGVRVFYLTNRAKDLGAVTLANLRKLGFPVHKNAFLGLGTYVKGCEQIGSQKTCRRELIGRHYRVLMQFGDQVGDFVTILSNTPNGRRKAVAPYMDWIGERWFVLPNPMYGSWEPALFDNIWDQPATQRRKDKIDAMHTYEK
jgi:5'-nucleotidase (lipoprotein e(P4) family)